MPSFWEELQALTAEYEQAKDSVVEQARAFCYDSAAEPEPDTLEAAVKALDQAQLALGMKTAQLVRQIVAAGGKGEPAPPGLPDELAPAEPPPIRAAQARRRQCSFNPCEEWKGLRMCGQCSEFFCARHHDPALHPCGAVGVGEEIQEEIE